MLARLVFLKAAAAFALASALLQGQVAPSPVQAPPEVLAALRAWAGTAQDLALPRSSSTPFQVRVHVAGAERTLSLHPHDVRAPDFQLLVQDAAGVHPVAAPPSVTFRGSVSGMAGAEVAASLIDGQLFATVHTAEGEIWGIQPISEFIAALPRHIHVIYRGGDVSLPEGVRCGVAHGAIKHEGEVGPTVLKIADIAIDADLAFYIRYGANVANVQNRVTTVMNSVNVIYVRDCEIQHRITTILVRTTNIYAFTGDLCNLLGQFGNYWAANHGAIVRDLAHLFTGEGTFSGVVGCAFVGVVCTNSHYGVSKAYHGNLVVDTGLVAHEIGHNWNAPHCDASPPCYIMCSGLGGCAGNLTSFSAGEIAVIVAFKNTRGCLNDLPPASFTIASSCNPNVVMNVASIPTSSTATAEGTQNLRWNGAAGQDQLFGNWWWYRAPGDTREHAFNNGPTSGYQGTVVGSKGDQAVMRWTNVDGKGFNAELRYRAYSTGATSGVVSECMRITNLTNAPIALSLFNYADFDVCATSGTDNAVFVQAMPNPEQRITDAGCPVQIFFQGCNVTAYQTTAFSTVRGLLTNASVDNLNNTGVPFGPGDWTSAYQWNITVPANGSVEIYEALSCGLQIPCCNVATITPFCVAKPGTNGLPR
jgi:hypothetical protein